MATATARRPKKPKRLSRTNAPEGMELRDWQRALRQQFAKELPLRIRNLGPNKVFSEFLVTNPKSERSYRVAVRGDVAGVNYCECPDYKVNTLGTCKHIEAVLHKLRQRHGKMLQREYVPPFAEVYVRYGPHRTVQFAPGADCPVALTRLAADYFDEQGQLRSRGFERFDEFLKKAGRIDHEFRVYDDAVALVAELHDAKRRRTALKSRYRGKNGAARWNKLLKTKLYPYQREGCLFAAEAGRAIIADEMGLGKTVQAIAASEILGREFGAQRVLIICPASLKSQWKQEIARFAAKEALIIQGPWHVRRKLFEDDASAYKIVNYDVLHRDLEAIEHWSPDLVILDEAQRIKNWETRAAKSVKQLQTPYALVLTGTPLENRLEELHSIVEFVDRFRLGPLFAFKAAHEIREEGSIRVVGYENLNRVTQTLQPILLRRTKQQVLKQLPPRMDKNFFVPMTPEQQVHHDENREVVARIVAKWNRYHYLSDADQLRLRIALQNMRMACDNTYLVDHRTRFGPKIEELRTLLGEIFEQPEAKVVIFSQWLRMNELVAEMLEEMGWGHVHLHGGVPSGQRGELIRALREDDDCRVFLSTDAGGVGLNLQRASTVINMDLPWNPAVLEQRIGRCHRLGQAKPVRVVNFVSESTIEHGMLSLLAFKKSMFAGVLDGASDRVMMGGSALSRFMKTVETATSSTPAAAPAADVEEIEEAASTSSVSSHEAGANGKAGVSNSASAELDSLSTMLNQGAALLQSVAKVLAGSGDGRDKGNGNHGGARQPRLTSDPATGGTELRVPLPDRETLQQWTSLLSQIVRQIRLPQ